jgi:hypothetical protein
MNASLKKANYRVINLPPCCDNCRHVKRGVVYDDDDYKYGEHGCSRIAVDGYSREIVDRLGLCDKYESE